MESIEMLKALYDFQAVYPKTISFDEGEYFILYQTSARQRNWWQVVSMKGNIGFVPSNYVMKIKVEPDFLISFLNSSIESLEKSKETEINGIMPKEELLERLREKKMSMEKLYLDYSERDCDSSLSFSQSISEKNYSKSHSNRATSASAQQTPHSPQSPPRSNRLDSNKKSMSSPAVGVVMPQIMQESTSMGTVQIQTQQSQLQQQQQQSQQSQSNNKGSDITQDNSITSEPSETTTTTTTTSEDVVTTFKESSQRESSLQNYSKHNGNDRQCEAEDVGGVGGSNNSCNGSGVVGGNGVTGGGTNTLTDASEHFNDEKVAEKSEGSEPISDGRDGTTLANDGRGDFTNSVENSQALDSEDSAVEQGLQTGVIATSTSTVNAAMYGVTRANLKVESSDVYQIVDIIRRNTNLSFDLSCEALRVVLTSLEQLYNGAINPYLEAVAIHVTDKVETPKALLGMTHDSKRLQYIFSQLADCKNDTEQRSWMLYEDEDDIMQFLEELVEILNNADENISCYEMSCDQYQVLINLVQYYQMETRWPIKQLLLKAFTAACHLDHIIVDILLTSVLPLEIVEDMKTNFANLDKFKKLVKMLTIIFSLGQPMPVNHQDYLGVHFASFLLEIVEGNNPESLVDMVISLILAFNLQFTDFSQNVVVEAMQSLPTAKIFTEKILLLLNREEDPIRVLKHSTETMNSVLKMFIDIFSNPDTAGMFYTNDNKVLIDILVRQLSDLCAGNPMRRCYLELCRRILRNTNYPEHQHRKQDFMKIFTRIFCEETECSASDQQLVREIANEFPQLFKA
ncbi:NCK-interacting protein with SH3 domain isoform X2 [Anastrepha obliqua]|uniref:NCK-interacting protein with SH3 domain isoform X1 n=2 Tax=Anastrepha obliqua TaxID=95512 RepID=UPI002409E1F5|nr:NCK-interacting protein with SH3 domain isoform X1 [Anastrepha obliqua]XP_054728054.1 NCK-interacting protein with SH3 domain isoform X2 [Anastrepha obliqua]